MYRQANFVKILIFDRPVCVCTNSCARAYYMRNGRVFFAQYRTGPIAALPVVAVLEAKAQISGPICRSYPSHAKKKLFFSCQRRAIALFSTISDNRMVRFSGIKQNNNLSKIERIQGSRKRIRSIYYNERYSKRPPRRRRTFRPPDTPLEPEVKALCL